MFLLLYFGYHFHLGRQSFSWAICSLSMSSSHQFRLLKIQMTCAICVSLCAFSCRSLAERTSDANASCRCHICTSFVVCPLFWPLLRAQVSSIRLIALHSFLFFPLADLAFSFTRLGIKSKSNNNSKIASRMMIMPSDGKCHH